MSTSTPTSHQAKQSHRIAAFLAHVLLNASIMFVAVLFPCATPSLVQLNVAESEVPFDEDESSGEEAISVQVRTRVVGNQPSRPLLVPSRGVLNAATGNLASLPHSGHRLSNHLLAPLRC